MNTVTSVSVKKQGTGKKGPWTMYAVELDNGTAASGFDFVVIGDTVEVKQQGQYLNYTKVGNGGGRKQSSAPPPRNGNGGNGDDRSSRIERQHSQEMAIRYCDLRGQKEISTAGLREMIDWFCRDVGHVPNNDSAAKAPTKSELAADPDDTGDIPF